MFKNETNRAYFHLPGLFEHIEFYRVFLKVFSEHREYFRDYCEIGSIYGAPSDCIWGGGRIESDECPPFEVISLLNEYGISPRLTFSNSLLGKEHLSDERCNEICRLFHRDVKADTGIIIYSDMLMQYLKTGYPNFYYVSSTTKVQTDFEELMSEVRNEDYAYVVPDFRLNKALEKLDTLAKEEKRKVEFLVNECCDTGCMARKRCYEEVSRKALGEEATDFVCSSDRAALGYQFSTAMKNPAFISTEDIEKIYLPRGFTNFKIEGRGLGSALLLEFILYYMVKPEYHINVRENMYLSNTLDLF